MGTPGGDKIELDLSPVDTKVPGARILPHVDFDFGGREESFFSNPTVRNQSSLLMKRIGWLFIYLTIFSFFFFGSKKKYKWVQVRSKME